MELTASAISGWFVDVKKITSTFLALIGVTACVSTTALTGCSSSDDTNPNTDSVDAGNGNGNGNGTDAGDTGPAPITAEAGKWSFVPFDDSACANGSPTGIGVNLGSSKRVLVFVEGGGACWDETTCYTFQTATNISTGFGAGDLADTFKGSQTNSIFDRSAASNAFKDYSFVYIPYCTGDVHAGAKEQTYGDKVTKHYGRKNIEAYIKRLVPTFKDSERIVVSGSSAGGFGAAINYWRFAEAFSGTRVDLIDDSGPPFPATVENYTKRFTTWSAQWDMSGAFPSDCENCSTDAAKLLPYYFTKYPNSRFALLSYTEDPTIGQFYALTTSQFTAGLTEMASEKLDGASNGRYYFITGAKHTMLRTTEVSSAGVTLATWLNDMATDAAGWANVKP